MSDVKSSPPLIEHRQKLPWITLLIAAVSLAAYCWPALTDSFQYDRAAIADGEVWRLLTSHVTHWNLDHLAWDWGVFVLLGALCERRNRRAFAACLGLAALVIPLGVLLLMPQMALYRGLSGLDTALFTLLGAMLLRDAMQNRHWLSAAVIGGLFTALTAKICFELYTGSTLFVDDASAGFIPLPLAHILGAAAGLAAAAQCSRHTPCAVKPRPQSAPAPCVKKPASLWVASLQQPERRMVSERFRTSAVIVSAALLPPW